MATQQIRDAHFYCRWGEGGGDTRPHPNRTDEASEICSVLDCYEKAGDATYMHAHSKLTSGGRGAMAHFLTRMLCSTAVIMS